MGNNWGNSCLIEKKFVYLSMEFIYYEEGWNDRSGQVQPGGAIPTGSSSYDPKRSW